MQNNTRCNFCFSKIHLKLQRSVGPNYSWHFWHWDFFYLFGMLSQTTTCSTCKVTYWFLTVIWTKSEWHYRMDCSSMTEGEGTWKNGYCGPVIFVSYESSPTGWQKIVLRSYGYPTVKTCHQSVEVRQYWWKYIWICVSKIDNCLD